MSRSIFCNLFVPKIFPKTLHYLKLDILRVGMSVIELSGFILQRRGQETFCKGPDSKNFRLLGSYGLRYNYSTPPSEHLKQPEKVHKHVGIAVFQ